MVIISVRDCFDPSAIVRPEGLCKLKTPVTTSGVELSPIPLVAQCLSQLFHSVPPQQWRVRQYRRLRMPFTFYKLIKHTKNHKTTAQLSGSNTFCIAKKSKTKGICYKYKNFYKNILQYIQFSTF